MSHLCGPTQGLTVCRAVRCNSTEWIQAEAAHRLPPVTAKGNMAHASRVSTLPGGDARVVLNWLNLHLNCNPPLVLDETVVDETVRHETVLHELTIFLSQRSSRTCYGSIKQPASSPPKAGKQDRERNHIAVPKADLRWPVEPNWQPSGCGAICSSGGAATGRARRTPRRRWRSSARAAPYGRGSPGLAAAPTPS